MDLVSIGEAARRLGLNASALRYYEDRGLVQPATKRHGRRMYGPVELRRIAFIQVARRLGLGLEVAGGVLDQPSTAWKQAVRQEIATLAELMAQAKLAQDFLTHALSCPAEHPVRHCPFMIEALDRLVAGVPFEQLAAEHAERRPTDTAAGPEKRRRRRR